MVGVDAPGPAAGAAGTHRLRLPKAQTVRAIRRDGLPVPFRVDSGVALVTVDAGGVYEVHVR